MKESQSYANTSLYFRICLERWKIWLLLIRVDIGIYMLNLFNHQCRCFKVSTQSSIHQLIHFILKKNKYCSTHILLARETCSGLFCCKRLATSTLLISSRISETRTINSFWRDKVDMFVLAPQEMCQLLLNLSCFSMKYWKPKTLLITLLEQMPLWCYRGYFYDKKILLLWKFWLSL